MDGVVFVFPAGQRCATCDGPPVQRDAADDLVWLRLKTEPDTLYCCDACLEIAVALGLERAHYLATGFSGDEPRYSLKP